MQDGLARVRSAGAPLIAVMLVFQAVILLLATPLIGWLFKEALYANGMVGLDFGTMRLTGGIGVSILLLFVILLLAFWLAVLQFTAVIIMLHRAHRGAPISIQEFAIDAKHVARKLWRPSSISLFIYLFLILPLSGFGFVSVLSQGISVPSFISGELLKSPATAVVWVGFILLIVFFNVRFALSLPIFVLTSATGGQAMRQSWRLTAGWASLWLAIAVILVLFIAGLLTFVLAMLALVPTAIADEAAPDSAAVVAAFGLGAAQMLGIVLTSLVTALIVGILLTLLRRRAALLPESIRTSSFVLEQGPAVADELNRRSRGHSLAVVVTATATAAAIALGVVHIGTMQHLSDHPDTLVIGHRGFSDGGAENTIGGLEAAAAIGADLVEIDVMQTADKRFVVMHDASLSRLAGIDAMVKDLTLDELTAITVRDQFGHEGKIPSLADYITRAAELEMPLLIEIKLGGLDSPDFVELLIAELEELDAMRSNIFHTLDHASAEQLKRMRPASVVGYILAFAGGGLPETSADFIVIEQFTATQEMQDDANAAGLGFFAWTVNDEPGVREFLRRDADGIITDHPDLALAAREEMQDESGLAGRLLDALTRFVVVF